VVGKVFPCDKAETGTDTVMEDEAEGEEGWETASEDEAMVSQQLMQQLSLSLAAFDF
jgi:hypothetical protein